ncbi:hypothetical protein EUX98_g5796, partial [Antrodiella citrinella]
MRVADERLFKHPCPSRLHSHWAEAAFFMNGTTQRPEDTAGAGPSSLLSFSDTDGDEETHEDHGGDYSTRFDELMTDEENNSSSEDEEAEGGFLYEGVDAEPAGGYREQLRDVLGTEHEEDELESATDHRSLLKAVEENERFASAMDDEAMNTDSAPETATIPHAKEAEDREVFRWTELRNIGDYLYRNAVPSSKAAEILGTSDVGSPTVLTANGLICVGTDNGKILVFDFKQNLICICGEESQLGAVTALALSFDHTFVAAGHASGYIQLFNINNPKVAARFVAPTSLAAVASGRQEGHLLGSRIVSIGFVAGRHTAVVSADETGLAFYHSLGKVLFVEASDILRILGKYSDETTTSDSVPTPTMALPTAYQHTFRRRRQRKANTILAMSPLPLGTAAHPTDTYNLVALLTPMKLVIVGLRPTPRTWYRRHRDTDEEPPAKSRFKGSLAWYPSVESNEKDPLKPTAQKQNGHASLPSPSLVPVLVYSWGNTLYLIRVSEIKVQEKIKNPRSGKVTTAETGRIVFEEGGQWTTDSDILTVQWLNANQVLVLTTTTLEVYDIRTLKIIDRVLFDAWSLVSPTLSHTTNGSLSYSDAVTEVAHAIRIYKGKIFCLGQHSLSVGTLLTWADRILTFVSNGDFLSAINLTSTYYTGKARGNRNGLPDKPEEIRTVIGSKLRELMFASASYAFSEERLTDSTHVTPDGRGVDRTDLFEGLVVSCAQVSMELDDFEFLFEDLYQYYYDNGISRMYLLQLEPFILDGSIHQVPPRVTQRLIALHDEDNRPDLVERVIWHIDPDCLDINQAITLCQSYRLHDALIYVYTRAMGDYVAPVVELVGLIRKINQQRRARLTGSPVFATFATDEAVEADILNAYKIYPYLANTLTGLTYPSERPLPEEEALRAKTDVYAFLFNGRSGVWPAVGEGGKLVLTSEDENGEEPTYPYTRLLLRFDAEAFLHTLDIAFEDSFLNKKSRPINRLIITKILFEILSTSSLTPSDATFVNIFIARNFPKYSQFIQMTPSHLQGILIGLAESHDEDTREDRQLAAEYLLSAYTPDESDHILHLFKLAGFYRILRSWHRQEQQWIPLIDTFLQDPDYPPQEVFTSVAGVIATASRMNKGTLPLEILSAIEESLPRLLQINIASTASLLDKRIPDLHEDALAALGPEATLQRFAYLRYLLGSPQSLEDIESGEHHRKGGPSVHVPPVLRQEYVSLLCEQDPEGVVRELGYLPLDFLDWKQVLDTCEEHAVYDAVIWALNHKGDPMASVAKAASLDQTLSTQVVHALKPASDSHDAHDNLESLLVSLQTVGRAAVAVCQERSKALDGDVQLDNLWFAVLESQISAVHKVSLCCSSKDQSALPDTDTTTSTQAQREHNALQTLRNLVQSTFTSLMSTSTSSQHRTVSFPRLFKRLVDAASGGSGGGAVYDEFRAILTGMLESYRSDGDLLGITRQILDRDFYEVVKEGAAER